MWTRSKLNFSFCSLVVRVHPTPTPKQPWTRAAPPTLHYAPRWSLCMRPLQLAAGTTKGTRGTDTTPCTHRYPSPGRAHHGWPTRACRSCTRWRCNKGKTPRKEQTPQFEYQKIAHAPMNLTEPVSTLKAHRSFVGDEGHNGGDRGRRWTPSIR